MKYKIIVTDNTVRDMSRQCTNKQQYDKKGALSEAKRVHRSGRVKEVRIYPCEDHWHIAKHRPDGKTRE